MFWQPSPAGAGLQWHLLSLFPPQRGHSAAPAPSTEDEISLAGNRGEQIVQTHLVTAGSTSYYMVYTSSLVSCLPLISISSALWVLHGWDEVSHEMQERQEGRSETWCKADNPGSLSGSSRQKKQYNGWIYVRFIRSSSDNYANFYSLSGQTHLPRIQLDKPLCLWLCALLFLCCDCFHRLLIAPECSSPERGICAAVQTYGRFSRHSNTNTKQRVWGNPLGPQHDGRQDNSKNLKETQVWMVFPFITPTTY